MGSVHSDLHSWACRARRQGQTTIEIELEVADRAAEKIVELSNRVMDLEHELRARSSAPEAREGEAVAGLTVTLVGEPSPIPGVPSFAIRKWSNHGLTAGEYRLYTHPAAPSADKLRIAVEALEKISNKTYARGQHRTIAAKALAALKAEGA